MIETDLARQEMVYWIARYSLVFSHFVINNGP